MLYRKKKNIFNKKKDIVKEKVVLNEENQTLYVYKKLPNFGYPEKFETAQTMADVFSRINDLNFSKSDLDKIIHKDLNLNSLSNVSKYIIKKSIPFTNKNKVICFAVAIYHHLKYHGNLAKLPWSQLTTGKRCLLPQFLRGLSDQTLFFLYFRIEINVPASVPVLLLNNQ